MTYCRTVEEVMAAGADAVKDFPPPSQRAMDLAAIRARHARQDPPGTQHNAALVVKEYE